MAAVTFDPDVALSDLVNSNDALMNMTSLFVSEGGYLRRLKILGQFTNLVGLRD